MRKSKAKIVVRLRQIGIAHDCLPKLLERTRVIVLLPVQQAKTGVGLSVVGLRYLYVFLGGVLAGLGGAYISLAYNPGWVENMTAGRGWIAIALVIFATWNPARAALGAYLFGGVEALQFRLQGPGTFIPPFFLSMLPYIFTILVLVLATRETARKRIGAPAALGLPYFREDRS